LRFVTILYLANLGCVGQHRTIFCSRPSCYNSS